MQLSRRSEERVGSSRKSGARWDFYFTDEEVKDGFAFHVSGISELAH